VLVVLVEDGNIGTRGADEGGTIVVVGSQLDGLLSRNTIGGNEHDSFGKGTEEGKILERHLAGAVLADVAAGVGSYHLEVVARDACDADLIGCPAEEGCEGGAEGELAPAGQSSCNAHHVLLSDEALDEALRELISHRDCEGAHLGVAVESHYSCISLSGLQQTVAVCLSGRDLVSFVVVGSHGETEGLSRQVVALRSVGLVFNVFVLEVLSQFFKGSIELSS
jgi:hypothetical protein